jgi:hypothetical protein
MLIATSTTTGDVLNMRGIVITSSPQTANQSLNTTNSVLFASVSSTNGFVSSAPVSAFDLDVSNKATSYTNGASAFFPAFSGMIIVNSYSTGNVASWLVGGGSVAKLGDSLSNTSGIFQFDLTNSRYVWVNNTGGTISASFAAIRTRSAS